MWKWQSKADWLKFSGSPCSGQVASPGTADSFLKVSHASDTRYAHQVNASSLYILLQNAYVQYAQDLREEEAPMGMINGETSEN